jgi:hypothetical protein
MLTQINARRLLDAENIIEINIQVACQQLAKAYRSMCTIRKVEERVH